MWMSCPPSARLGESFEDQGSEYAQEGTLAHRIGELLLRKRWEGADITADLEAAQVDPLYSGEMGECMEAYAAFIEERMGEAKTRCGDPRIFIEQTVKFDEYVPEGFGTSDAIIISDGLMDVVDLKYGKGVPVSAEGNPQMKLYALGCYLALSWAYEISTIRMNIFQPRLDNISTVTITRAELLDWAENELNPGPPWPGRAREISAPVRGRAGGAGLPLSAGRTATTSWSLPSGILRTRRSCPPTRWPRSWPGCPP